jgi:Dyp-type peroxidase family
VSFTSSGLVTLDSGLARDLVAYDAFWQGPLVDREYRGERRTSPAVVGDVHRGDPRTWVVGGPSQYPVDALVTIAADDEDDLRLLGERERGRAANLGLAVLSWQDCRRLNPDGYGIEPFGFRDGISQPGVRGFTGAVDGTKFREAADQPGSPIIAAGEFLLGYDGETGGFPEVRRPRPPEWMRDGSFQVFLRLRQDVDGWRTQMRELTESSGGTLDAAATAIGRQQNGEPLAPLVGGEDLNNFTFEDDELGEATRRFAHIRKMNPRNGTFEDRIHRLLRRGIPFETPLHVETSLPGADGIVDDEVEQGLAFNAFMASIENQFEFLLRSWASNPDSLPPVAADGPDPVLGASDAPCVIRRGEAESVEIHFGRFVWTSGAVYAFAPSLAQLNRLAGPDR